MQTKYRSSQGFTLVELIVVITILAILGTIGFLSLQGYSGQSRDSKRIADLRTLSTLISTKTTEGISLMTTVSSTTVNARFAATNFLAGTGVIYGTDYDAGVPNYTALGISASNFLSSTFTDPTGGEYRLGVNAKNGGVFQIAAKMEPSGAFANWVAKVVGNYNWRTSEVISASGSVSSPVLSNLPADSINKIKEGDTIWSIGLTTDAPYLVSKVSRDSRTLVLTTNLTAGTLTGIRLGNVVAGRNEPTGLIATSATGSTIVVDGAGDLPY